MITLTIHMGECYITEKDINHTHHLVNVDTKYLVKKK